MSVIMEHVNDGHVLTANVNVLEAFRFFPANYIMQMEIVTKQKIKNEANFQFSTIYKQYPKRACLTVHERIVIHVI